MPRCGSGSVPIAIGWKCTNSRRTHRSSIPRSAFGNTRARPELTTGTSQPPRNWSAPCHGSSERCNSILNRSDPICFLFAGRDVPLLMRGCIAVESVAKLLAAGDPVYFTLQNMSEFWNVATRPVSNNGLGFSVALALGEMEKIERFLTVLPDSPAVYWEWKRLVVQHSVLGSKVHDAKRS